MDGVSHVAGIGPTIELGGKQWIIKGRTIEYYALLEAEIIKLRGNPFDMIIAAAKENPGPEGAMLVNVIASAVAERFRNWRIATYNDYQNFIFSPYGEAFQIWCCLLSKDSVTVHQVQFWIMELLRSGREKLDKILDAIDQASSEDKMGN